MALKTSADSKSFLSHDETFRDLPIGSVHVTGDFNEFVVVGDKKYAAHELMKAFGGIIVNQPAPARASQFGNPASLGLNALAVTTFVISMVNAGVLQLLKPNIVIGLSCFYGGFAQFAAGIWEMVLGNTFGSVALTLFGAFWLSYSSLSIGAFGIADAYNGQEAQFHNAVGFFLLGWTFFTFILLLLTLKSTVAFITLFVLLEVTFILLVCGEFLGSASVIKAAGISGIITSFVAWYNACASFATKENSYFTYYSMALSRQD